MTEGMLFDLVMDLRYLNILLLLVDAKVLMRLDSKVCLATSILSWRVFSREPIVLGICCVG